MADPEIAVKGMKGYDRLVEHYLPCPMGTKLIEALESLSTRWA